MNRFIVVGVSALVLSSMSMVVAQNTKAAATPSVQGSNVHSLGMRYRQDMMQIQKDLKSGKLTQAEATSLKGQILAVRKEELADFKTNGSKTITDTQESSLLGQLETIEKSL